MIYGARAALSRAGGKQDPRSLWLGKMRQRRHPNVAAVALANKKCADRVDYAHQRHSLRTHAIGEGSVKRGGE